MKQNELITRAERAHSQILSLVRKAIRAGDVAKAERWLKVAERNYKACALAYRAHDDRVARAAAARARRRYIAH